MSLAPRRLGWFPLHLNERRIYRWLEIAPGFFVWTTLVAAVVLCFVRPIWAIGFVIVFDVYWLIRILYVMSFVILAFVRFRQASKIHWLQKLQSVPGWRDVYHVIIIPMATESLPVLESTMQSLVNLEYPNDRLLVVLAIEGRCHDLARPTAEAIAARYGSKFASFLITEHPDHLPGEVAGKGANIAWAGRQIKTIIDQRAIPYEKTLVSTFDADSIAHPQYISYLTYAFLHHPNRLRTSYQPIPLFINNAWEALPLMRVVSNSTTFWLMGETLRPDRLFTFSSHSMPFQALVDVDFWQADVVSEDSRIFLQCLIRYDGDYTVTPMYIPISMDTVQGATWWRSMINQYKQIRRWAYGAENFPFMVWNFAHDRALPLSKKIRYIFYQIEGSYSWAVAPLLIMIMGWLPFHVQKEVLQTSALAQNAPGILHGLMLLAMIGAVISALLSLVLLPSRPRHIGAYHWTFMALQWLLLPITMILFGAIPALEAQSRLMFAKYLGFWVTEKTRTKAGS